MGLCLKIYGRRGYPSTWPDTVDEHPHDYEYLKSLVLNKPTMDPIFGSRRNSDPCIYDLEQNPSMFRDEDANLGQLHSHIKKYIY